MGRIAFKMFLKPGCKEIYKQRHDEIWPSVKKLLKDEGISDYSIFLDESSHTLFAVQNQALGRTSQGLAECEIVQLWWKYMADIMETNPDLSPITEPLELLFFME